MGWWESWVYAEQGSSVSALTPKTSLNGRIPGTRILGAAISKFQVLLLSVLVHFQDASE